MVEWIKNTTANCYSRWVLHQKCTRVKKLLLFWSITKPFFSLRERQVFCALTSKTSSYKNNVTRCWTSNTTKTLVVKSDWKRETQLFKQYLHLCERQEWKRCGFLAWKDLVLDHLDDYLACNLIADFSDNHSLFKCQKFHWQLRMRDRKQCALEVTPPSLSVNKGSNWKTNSQLQNTLLLSSTISVTVIALVIIQCNFTALELYGKP